MDPRLFSYFEAELQYLHEVGAEFAQAHPLIAAELELKGGRPADPYVERLLEGAAFLAARVQLKIDARVPDFTEQLLSLVLPTAVAPIPACGIVEFQPARAEPALREGVRIPRGTALRTPLEKGGRSSCEFRTAHDVTLWPISVTSVRHLGGTGTLAANGLSVGSGVRGAIMIRLETSGGIQFSSLPMEALDLYLAGRPNIGPRLYSLVTAHCVGGAVLQQPGGGRIGVEPIGLSDDEAILPIPPASFRAYRALQEYFVLPERVSFIRLTNLRQALAAANSDSVEIALLLGDTDRSLEGALAPDHVRLGCTPVVNLFPKTIDRIAIDGRNTEYHLVPDRSHPLDFEIHSVTQVSSFSAGGSDPQTVVPFYFYRHADRDRRTSAYYTLKRQTRISPAPNDPKPQRSGYVGTETFVSLVDSEGDFISGEPRQLQIEAFCTNRDLPLLTSFGRGRTDFVRDGIPAVESVRCIAGPSLPRPAPAFGSTTWYLVGLLAANHLGLSGNGSTMDAQSLRTVLGLFANTSDSATRRRIEGIRDLSCKPSIRRIPNAGPICYARGLAIGLHVEADAFEGEAIPMGAVIDEFLARSTTINSFVELSLFDLRNPKDPIKRWKPRSGNRQVL